MHTDGACRGVGSHHGDEADRDVLADRGLKHEVHLGTEVAEDDAEQAVQPEADPDQRHQAADLDRDTAADELSIVACRAEIC